MKRLDDRADFSTDEAFANFRALILNNKISANFYRSASSTNDKYGRAKTVQKIMQKNQISTVIDFSNLQCKCQSDQFGYAVAESLRKLQTKQLPCIIQCDAGKKRTGFVCIILEALSGTSYDNIVQDYLESYRNNNGLDTDRDPVTTQRIIRQNINPRIEYIANCTEEICAINLQSAVAEYLLRYNMTFTEIASLQELLLK